MNVSEYNINENQTNLLENDPFDLDIHKIFSPNDKDDNTYSNEEDSRYFNREQSQIPSPIELFNNLNNQNNILGEGQSSKSQIDNSSNNDNKSDRIIVNFVKFSLTSKLQYDDFKSIPQEYHSDNEQNFGYINLEENKEGVIQKDTIKSKKILKIKNDVVLSNNKIQQNRNRKIYKLSNYKIRWRTAVIQFYMGLINKLLKESDLPKKLKFKFNTPNYEEFTEKANIEKTSSELGKKMKDILILKKIKRRKNTNQEQEGNNSKNIKELEDFYEKNKDSLTPQKNLKEIIELLNNTYEEIIKKFYDSEDIEIFKKKDDIKSYDEKFMNNGKRKSLFEKYGLIELLKKKKFRTKKYLTGNKRRRKNKNVY